MVVETLLLRLLLSCDVSWYLNRPIQMFCCMYWIQRNLNILSLDSKYTEKSNICYNIFGLTMSSKVGPCTTSVCNSYFQVFDFYEILKRQVKNIRSKNLICEIRKTLIRQAL